MSSPFDHRVRAGVMAYLSDRSSADFVELATALEVPNNLLSAHIQRLEAEGLIKTERSFIDRKRNTRVVVTNKGRRAWAGYLDGMDA